MKRYAKAIVVVALSALLLPLQDNQAKVTIQETKPAEVVVEKPVEKPVETPVVRHGCEIAYNYDWNAKVAYAVCMAESGGNQNAHNKGDNHKTCIGSYSLFQVGCFWYPYFGYSENDFYNPQINADIAYKIWKRQGSFKAWSAYNNGSYLKYL